jgi:hypothetical protein
MSNLSILIIVDSKDRANPAGTTTSNFTYNMEYYGPNSVKGMRVNKITIPFSWNPVLAQTFVLTIGGTPANIVIPAGQWTNQQMASLIQAQITADFPSSLATFTWSPGSNLFTFTSPSNPYELNFTGATLHLYQNIGYMMGFFGLQSSPIIISASPGSSSSVIYPNLSGGPNVYVQSQKLQLYDSCFFQTVRGSVIQSVPVNVNVGNYIVWQNSIETVFPLVNSQPYSNFDFKLIDDYGNEVLLNGLDWVIELQFFYDF